MSPARREPAAARGDAERIEIAYSLPTAAAATALFLLAAGWVGFWVVVGTFSGHVIALAVGLCALLVGLPLVLSFARAVLHPWRHRGPVLTLDAEGVTDVRKPCRFIPWSDIGSIELGTGDTAAFLCFGFRRPDRQREDRPSAGALGTVLRRARSLGDWNVSLRLLACRKQEVLRAARRLHQQSLRRQVVERNRVRGDPNNGWSGQL